MCAELHYIEIIIKYMPPLFSIARDIYVITVVRILSSVYPTAGRNKFDSTELHAKKVLN